MNLSVSNYSPSPKGQKKSHLRPHSSPTAFRHVASAIRRDQSARTIHLAPPLTPSTATLLNLHKRYAAHLFDASYDTLAHLRVLAHQRPPPRPLRAHPRPTTGAGLHARCDARTSRCVPCARAAPAHPTMLTLRLRQHGSRTQMPRIRTARACSHPLHKCSCRLVLVLECTAPTVTQLKRHRPVRYHPVSHAAVHRRPPLSAGAQAMVYSLVRHVCPLVLTPPCSASAGADTPAPPAPAS